MTNKEDENRVKVIKVLLKNARAQLSEISGKTGLSRQTVGKIIHNFEKEKQIWGYAPIIDSKIIGKNQYIALVNLNLVDDTEGFLKKVIEESMSINYDEKFEFRTSMFLHGNADLIVSWWSNDIIEAKKRLNTLKKIYKGFATEIQMYEVIATFRECGIVNPNYMEEWKNLLR